MTTTNICGVCRDPFSPYGHLKLWVVYKKRPRQFLCGLYVTRKGWLDLCGLALSPPVVPQPEGE